MTKQKTSDNESSLKEIVEVRSPALNHLYTVETKDPSPCFDDRSSAPASMVMIAETTTEPTPREAVTFGEIILPNSAMTRKLNNGTTGISQI
jgi:hypothetical protein